MAERLELDLPPEWAARLAEQARAEGVTIHQLVNRLLARSDDEIARLERRRLAELDRRPTDTVLH